MKKKMLDSYPVRVDRLSAKGWGVGSLQMTEESSSQKVVIPGTIPGDLVTVSLLSKQKGMYRGTLLQILEPSSLRASPRCAHVPICGGCSLQQMEYGEQLLYKQEEIKKLFSSLFSGLCSPIVASDSIWHYRNKMEYTFSQDKEGTRFLGLIRAASKGRVEPLKECYLSPIWFVTVLHAVLQWWNHSSLLAYNPHRNTGSLRTLTLREGRNTGEKMVVLTVSGIPEFALHKEQLKKFVTAIKQVVDVQSIDRLSLFLRVQQAMVGQPTQFYEMHLFGPAHIAEELTIGGDLNKRKYRFKISPTAFFQPNTTQAEKLYSKALDIAGTRKRSRVLDLYAGTATLGIIFSPFAEKVLSVELNPYAVFDAEMNREENGVENLTIARGDVAEVLRAYAKEDPSWHEPDLVLLDPPRTGLSHEALRLIVQLQSKEILYISCSPGTQARDCMDFISLGYEIVYIQPVDQFPHTVHIENIVYLRRK